MRPLPTMLRTPRLLAWLLIMASGLLLWRTQYYLDYEVSVLPWLVGRGWRLYGDMVDQHPPLLTWLLSLVGGDPGWPLQVVIVALHVLTLALVYRVAALLAGVWGGVVAVLLCALWLHAFEGTHLWFDGVLAPLYLLAAECGVRIGRRGADGARQVVSDRWLAFVMGLSLGVGVLIKQHAALASIMGGAWLVWIDREGWARRLGAFVLGLGLPLLTAGLWLFLQGTLGEAWYWVAQYTFESDYAREAALAPADGEWLVLGALYASLIAFVLAAWLGLVPARIAALLLGLAVVATLPAWPRYGRFHLGAALPLLVLAGGVGAVLLWRGLLRDRKVRGKLLSAVGLLAVALGGIMAASQSWHVLVEWKQLGEPRAPFEGSSAHLRAWVDSVSPQDEPVFTYKLDLLLYRVLEREPPKPFVPQLPWILKAHGAEGKMWRGVEREEPRVVLVDASWWDGTRVSARAAQSWPGISRYREAARFSILSYPGAPPVTVVGLLREE